MQEDSRLEEWHLVQNKSSGQIDGLSLLCDVRKQGGFCSTMSNLCSCWAENVVNNLTKMVNNFLMDD